MTNKTLSIIVGVIIIVVAGVALVVRNNGGDDGVRNAETGQSQNQTENTYTNQSGQQATEQNPSTNTTTPMSTEKQKVEMQVKGFGKIVVELDPVAAPKTAANFVKLTNEGFYNNLTFHRVARDFVIQGGDPKGDGSGGPGYTIPAEIKLNHKRGSIAMARLPDQVNPKQDSSGSQFYIALNDLPMLDGAYTVFGQVVEGMEVVDKISAVPIDPGPFGSTDGSPKTPVVIESVKIIK